MRLAASLSDFLCRLSECRQPTAQLREMPKLWARTSEQVGRSELRTQCLPGIWRPKNRARRKWEVFRQMARILGITINLGKYPMEGGFGKFVAFVWGGPPSRNTRQMISSVPECRWSRHTSW